MSHNLHAFFQTTRDRVGHWGTIEPPVISAAEQTRFSWARLVRSAEELPEIYRPFIESLPAGSAFPYAVLTPTFAGFLRREPEKLVCSVGEDLYVVEKSKGELVTTRYASADIYYLEAGAVLLNDWLQIRGRTSAGTFATTRFKFNAVTERLFTPFVEMIRGAANSAPGIDRDAELKKFDSRRFAVVQIQELRPAQSLAGRALQRRHLSAGNSQDGGQGLGTLLPAHDCDVAPVDPDRSRIDHHSR